MKKWIWTEPFPGTQFFPHHRRWDCRRAIVHAMRCMPDGWYWIGRAEAFNAVMFDCADPLASAYAARIEKIRRAMLGAIK